MRKRCAMAKLVFKKLDHDVYDFYCGNGSIERQIQDAYFQCLLEISYTFEISTNDGRVLGYICLKLHKIKPEDLPEEVGDVDIGYRFYFYAVELKFLAIEKSMQRNGLGTAVLDIIIKKLLAQHDSIPYRFIYIDALQERVSWYQEMGFSPFQEENDLQCATVPMYLDLNRNREKIDEYIAG